MDYNKLIEETTNKINNYTFDDGFYNDIYNKAKERLDTAYNDSLWALNTDYKAERRKAIGDNALATKSLKEELASRGLAHSGESAMLSINQSLALRNTVSDLARAAIRSRSELSSAYNKELSALEKEHANLKLSAMEKDKASLNDRLAHLESLQADKEKWSANYALEVLKENNRVKEKEAEREAAKNSVSVGEKEESTEKGGLPEITPSTAPAKAAESIINRFAPKGTKVIKGYTVQSNVRKELARLVCTMGLSKAYTQELIYVLSSYGFDGDFDIDVAASKNLKWLYGAYQQGYKEKYDYLVSQKVKASEAKVEADAAGKKKMAELAEKLNLSKYEIDRINSYIWF